MLGQVYKLRAAVGRVKFSGIDPETGVKLDLSQSGRRGVHERISIAGVEHDRFDISCETDASMHMCFDIAIQRIVFRGPHLLDEDRYFLELHNLLGLENRVRVAVGGTFRRLAPQPQKR